MNDIKKLLNASVVKEYMLDGKRMDGRSLEDYRKLEIKKDFINSAEGSVWVKLGDTEVIAGVKFGIGVPYPDSPNEGSMVLNLEISGVSSPEFRTGPPTIDAIEYGRVVDRAIRSSECIDFKKLSIVPGEKSFILFIDCFVINVGGNIIDAAGIAAISALLNTKIPKLDENYRIIKGEYSGKLEVRNLPLSITFAKINNKLVLDPSFDEENASDARLTLGVYKDNILSCQKGKGGFFTKNEIFKMVDLATSKYKILSSKISDLCDN